jgi:DNA-binding transcriptional regulator of glucitol operon
VRHFLALAAALTCLRLGVWQWDRYEGLRGGFQNLGYAIQWPLFGIAVVWFWARLVRWELHPPEQPEHVTRPHLGPSTTPGPQGQSEQAEPDDEHARYNRYLRSLAESDRRERDA